MVKNISIIIVSIILMVELYLAAAGNSHRMKRVHKGWRKTTGVIDSIVTKYDSLAKKNVAELTIISESGSRVYAKVSNAFCIYEKGETVYLEEKDGYHRFLGNERVGKRGTIEVILGTVPMIIILVGVALMAYYF
ncbi:MAG: hypothetical protein K6E28_02775 [Eubacterium sp.]|nr:hypothetical protein [Eubacterium sp.]